jgi:hypothetical protein
MRELYIQQVERDFGGWDGEVMREVADKNKEQDEEGCGKVVRADEMGGNAEEVRM